jgi:hypothetical protein
MNDDVSVFPLILIYFSFSRRVVKSDENLYGELKIIVALITLWVDGLVIKIIKFEILVNLNFTPMNDEIFRNNYDVIISLNFY